MKNNFKEIAQNYFDHELPVTPVHDKRPILKDWTAKLDDSILDDASAWRQANGIGLLMGQPSGICCLDIDIVPGMTELHDLLKDINAKLPPIQCGLVGNPLKPPARFFKWSGQRSQKFNNIHVEILCTGNQKVIPPSWNPQAKAKYSWTGQPLLEIDPDDLQEMPENLIEFLYIENEKFRESARGGAKNVSSLSPGEGRCNHGSHNVISHRALSLFFMGFRFDDIVDEVLAYDELINGSADSVYFECSSRPEFKGHDKRLNAQAFVGEMFHRNIKRRFDDSEFFKEELKNGFTWRDDKNRPHRQILSLYNFMKLKHDIWFLPEIKSFMVWNGKFYDKKPEDYVRKFAQDHFKNPPCTNIGDKNTFLDYARNEQQGSVQDFVLTDKGMVNFENGLVRISDLKRLKHDKSQRMVNLVPVRFPDQDLEAPVWDRLLDLVTLVRPHMKTAIEEYVGYILSGCSYDQHNKLLILDGGGSNGKSTLIRVIRDLVGHDNCSFVSLEAISKERFAAFSLVNKLVNFCAEEPKEAFANTGAIKKLTGGDAIMVEEKHKGAFPYENLAKLVISYNKMPFFPDDSTGMRRRVLLIPCEMDFEKAPEEKIDQPERRIRESEQPAIVRRCLKAWHGVLKRGSFTNVPEGLARVDEMIVESDPVRKFVGEYLAPSDNPFQILKFSSIWAEFCDFQGSKGKISKDGFSKRLKPLVTAIGGTHDRTKLEGRHYKGIKWREFD